MKNALLGAIVLILGAICLIMFMAIPEASATLIDNAELFPIPKTDITFATTGPTEVDFGPNVWIFLNDEKWQPVYEGNGIFRWNANIYYSPFDNAKVEFYYLAQGNDHAAEYPQAPTPIPPSVILFGTGLVSLCIFRRKVSK